MTFIRTWEPAETRFHLYILHGVAEHSGKYESLATAVTAIGGKVFCQDHKGHGKTAVEEGTPLGHFREADPVHAIVADARQVIQSTNPDKLPWVIFAHSGGCLYAEHVLKDLRDEECIQRLKGVIFSGPPAIPSLIERVAFRFLLNIFNLLNRGQWVVKALTFGKYDKQISAMTGKKLEMKNEWLCSDINEVKIYNEDPFCAHDMSFRFWRSFLAHISALTSSSFRISIKCPVLVVGGDMDGATDYGRSLEDLRKRLMARSAATSVEQVIYRGSRHTLLVETVKEIVLLKLTSWIKAAAAI